MIDHSQLPVAIRLFAPSVHSHERPIGKSHPRVVHWTDGKQGWRCSNRGCQLDFDVTSLIGSEINLHLYMLQVKHLSTFYRFLMRRVSWLKKNRKTNNYDEMIWWLTMQVAGRKLPAESKYARKSNTKLCGDTISLNKGKQKMLCGKAHLHRTKVTLNQRFYLRDLETSPVFRGEYSHWKKEITN